MTRRYQYRATDHDGDLTADEGIKALKEFAALPQDIQAAVLKDWVRCINTGWMRGVGVPDHYWYLDMIAQEQGITVLDVCAHEPREELI